MSDKRERNDKKKDEHLSLIKIKNPTNQKISREMYRESEIYHDKEKILKIMLDKKFGFISSFGLNLRMNQQSLQTWVLLLDLVANSSSSIRQILSCFRVLWDEWRYLLQPNQK